MSTLLLALLLQAAPAHPSPAPSAPVEAVTPAEGPAAAEHGPAAVEAVTAAAEHGAEARDAHGAEGGPIDPAQVLAHHVLDQPVFGMPSKHLLYLVIVALLVIALSQVAVRSYRGGSIPHGLGAAVEALVLFVRDDIAEPAIGHDGRKFTPLLCSFFFFILVAALFGLIPLPSYSHGKWSLAGTTATANITVTLGLALVSFAAQQYAGISRYGLARHLRNLIPPGLPLLMLPIMVPVEILSMFTKPFALMVRLFANMLAGHMVVTALLLLIPLMAQGSWLGGVAIAPFSIGLALFIMLLELLVALIQAYIFTLLSAIFIGLYAHPAH